MPLVSQGAIYRRRGTQNWAIKSYVDGQVRRETAGTPDRDQALSYLRRRVEEAARGTFIDRSPRITFRGMRELLFENYRFKGNRTDPSRHVKNLEACLGGLFGDEIDEAQIEEYARKRLDEDKVAPATVRRELAVLKRMLRLASRWLTRLPIFRMPRVDNSRQGFFEEDELQRLLPHLPAHARNLVEFLYLTGWRSGEAFRLTWRDVDWDRQIVRLRESKSREGRTFPFKYHPRLSALLARQRADVARWEREHGQLCLAVFHWRGRSMQKLRRSWRNACNAVGLPGRLLHDFRRTAVRNLICAGVPQAIAMKVTGHKTDSSFRRYLIVDEELLAQATGAVADYLGGPRSTHPDSSKVPAAGTGKDADLSSAGSVLVPGARGTETDGAGGRN